MLDEHERTMAFAEVALGPDQVACGRPPCLAITRSGTSTRPDTIPPLNKIINETLARNGKLTEADLEQIYDTYLSQIKTTDRIDKVGARVIGEIDDVMTLITDALGMSASYDDSLTGATKKLVGRAEPRPGQGGRRNAGEIHPRDARDQQGAGRPADAVEIGNQQSPAEPRGDQGRKPDRSAHRPRQPQIFRPLDRDGGSELRWRTASRFRC